MVAGVGPVPCGGGAESVGQAAGVFARVLDNNRLRIEAKVSGLKGDFEMPLVFTVFGPPDMDWEKEKIKWKTDIQQQHGLKFYQRGY